MMGTQTGIIPTNLPSFPWTDGDALDATPLNNEFFALQNQIANLVNQINVLNANQNQSHIGVSITTNWGGNTAITAGNYVLTGSSPYTFTIISADFFVGTNGGSYAAGLTINGVPVAGLTGIVVENLTEQNVLAPANTIVNKGDQLGLLISDVIGFPLNAWVGVNGTTNAVSEPVIGIGFGFATGVSNCIGTGTSVASNSALGAATGLSAAIAHAIASYMAAGHAIGSSTATATGVHVTIGSSSGVAAGLSTAVGVGGSITVVPTLVLDDSVVGILDVNPLG